MALCRMLIAWIPVVALLAAVPAACQDYLISTLAGGSPLPATALPGTQTSIPRPYGVASDKSGNLFISSETRHAIFKLDSSGTLFRVAGTGVAGFSGDGGPALLAQLNAPKGLKVGSDGAVYFADSRNHRIRKVLPSGDIVTVAGNGTPGPWGNGGAATSASLNFPSDIALDADDNLFIADTKNAAVRKVSADKIIRNVIPYLSYLSIYAPEALAFDAGGTLYIGDSSRVVKMTPAGKFTLFAGGGNSEEDNIQASKAQLGFTKGIAVDATGTVYLSNSNVGNYRVRKIDKDGTIVTVAGLLRRVGASGDGGPAFAALLDSPKGIATDSAGNLAIADYGNHRVRKVNPLGVINTIVGGLVGDGGPAVFALLSSKTQWGVGLARDKAGNLYFSDTGHNRVRRISVDGAITTIAGTGAAGFSGDGGMATNARLNQPKSVAVDSSGNVYVLDEGNYRIRVIASDGRIRTIAGTGDFGFVAPAVGTNAIQARLGGLTQGLAVDSDGNLCVADPVLEVVLRLNASGVIIQSARYPGPYLISPRLLAAVENGALYIAGDGGIWKLSKEGAFATVYSYAMTASNALGVDANGNVFFDRGYEYCIRKLTPDKTLSVIAGSCTVEGYSGDGETVGPKTALGSPGGLTVDPNGAVYLFDSGNDGIRVLTPVLNQALTAVEARQVGDFRRGDTAAAYDVTVRNLASAGPTRGAVTVSMVLPTGLSLTAVSGSGWTCSGPACTRSDVLDAGASYPPISVSVGVGRDVAAQITTSVTVSGGGAPMAGARVATNIESSSRPTILSVVNGASFEPGSSDGSWISVLGENFGTSTRPWKGSDLSGDKLPTLLDDVQVTIDGVAAAIAYVSPSQLNAQVPTTGRTGPVSVVVSNGTHGVSDFGMINIQRASPGVFTFSPGGGKYPAALVVRVDGQVEYLGPASLFGGALPTRPARAGETIVLYATGLGPTNPAVPAGVAFSGAAKTIDPVSVVIGGVKATVAFSGLVSPGLYQVNVVVPNSLDRESPLMLEVGGSAAQAGLVVAIAPN